MVRRNLEVLGVAFPVFLGQWAYAGLLYYQNIEVEDTEICVGCTTRIRVTAPSEWRDPPPEAGYSNCWVYKEGEPDMLRCSECFNVDGPWEFVLELRGGGEAQFTEMQGCGDLVPVAYQEEASGPATLLACAYFFFGGACGSEFNVDSGFQCYCPYYPVYPWWRPCRYYKDGTSMHFELPPGGTRDFYVYGTQCTQSEWPVKVMLWARRPIISPNCCAEYPDPGSDCCLSAPV